MSIEQKAKQKATNKNAKILTNKKVERLNSREPTKTVPVTPSVPQKK